MTERDGRLGPRFRPLAGSTPALRLSRRSRAAPLRFVEAPGSADGRALKGAHPLRTLRTPTHRSRIMPLSSILGRPQSAGEALRDRGRASAGLLGPPSSPRSPSLLDGGGGRRGGRPRGQQQQQPTPQQRAAIQQAQRIQQARRAQAAQQAQRNKEPGPGEEGLGLFGRLFLNDLNPDEQKALTKKEAGQLRQRAMVTAGLRMLGAPTGATFAQTLAGGVLAGQRHAAQTAGELLDAKRNQAAAVKYRSVFQDSDLTEIERLEEARRVALKRGDMRAVSTLNDVLKEVRSLEEGEAEREFRMVEGVPVWIDKENAKVYDTDGNLVRDLQQEIEDARAREEQRDPMEGAFREEVRGQDGRMHTVLFNRHGQPVKDLGVSEQAEGSGDGGEADPEQAQLAATIRREIGNIRSVIGDDPDTEEVEGADRFGMTGSFGRLARWLPSEAEPSELKQLRAASENILSLIIRQRSGAQATEAEVERLRSFAIPSPGDDPETTKTKLQRLENMVSDFERLGNANAVTDPVMLGRGAGGSRGVDAELDEIFGGGGL